MTGGDRLELVGHWFNPLAPSGLPLPQLLVGTRRSEERALVLRYLGAGRELVRFPEASFCRFDCGEEAMGSADLTDGRFVWPEGLGHYVERHDVRLPPAFVAHAIAKGGEVAPFRLPKARFGLYDPTPWLRWAVGEGGCLDLTGFEVPDAETRGRIADELGAAAPDDLSAIRLCNGVTREAVVAAADGSLTVHTLRAGARSVRQLTGWAAWPRAVSVSAAAVVGGVVGSPKSAKPKPGVPLAEFLAKRKSPPDEQPDR